MSNTSCNRCGRRIFTVWKSAKGNYYHPHCFTCAICDIVIHSETQLENSVLKEIYCKKCFHEYFGQPEDPVNNNMTTSNGNDAQQCQQSSEQKETPQLSSTQQNSCEMLPSPSPCPSSIAKHLQEEITEAICISASSYKKDTLSPHGTVCMQPPLPALEFNIATVKELDTTVTPQLIANKICTESHTSMISQFFASRIPILKSKTVENPPLVSCSTEALTSSICLPQTQNLVRLNSFRAPCQSVRSNITDYINSKGLKMKTPTSPPGKKEPQTPMKVVHNTNTLLDNNNYQRPRLVSTPRPKSVSSSALVNINSKNLKRGNSFAMPRFTVQNNNSMPSNSNQKTCPHSTQSNHKQQQQSIRRYMFPQEIINGTGGGPKIKSRPKEPSRTNNHSKSSLCRTMSSTSRISQDISTRDRDRNRLQFDPQQKDVPETLDCPICFDPLVNLHSSGLGKSKENLVTGCGHIFHKECIHCWLDKGNCRCPICSKLCLRESMIPVFVEANISEDVSCSLKNGDRNDELKSVLNTLRSDYRQLREKYQALVQEHSECEMRVAITESLKSAFEMESRTRGELQWENKRLHRKLQEMRAIMGISHGDSSSNH